MFLDDFLTVKLFCDQTPTYNLIIHWRRDTKDWKISIHRKIHFIDSNLDIALSLVIKYITSMPTKFEQFKVKYPELNWQEAEEVLEDDLKTGANFYDRMMRNRKLSFGHMGNGITVWETETNDQVAHIDQDRNIKWREQVNAKNTKEVEEYAKTADPEISATQEQKVFRERPITIKQE